MERDHEHCRGTFCNGMNEEEVDVEETIPECECPCSGCSYAIGFAHGKKETEPHG